MSSSTVSTLSSILNSSQLTSMGLGGTSNSSLASTLAISGLASGMNWQNTVLALADAERAPERLWQQQQATLSHQNAAFTTIASDLAALQADLTALLDPSLYGSSIAQTSDASLATATAASGASQGTFSFVISQLATAARIAGTAGISTALSPDGNLNNVTLATAGFASPVTAGTFTVNGAQVTIAASDSLQQVFDKIAAATNNTVTASYNPATDEITLSSTQEIVLGSAVDTSNFLQVAQLFNNGGNTITSAASLGHVQLTTSMSGAQLNTPVTDGGSGQGQFVINGVTISFNASTDSIQNVLDRINQSNAGVTASYDTLNNRFVLANNVTGDIGVALQDVTGNFLAATGLTGGTLQHGTNLLYSLNGGPTLVSQSNTITQASSGISGLSVTALAVGTVNVNVSSDPSQVTSAIQQFIKDYNAVQTFIASQQSVTSDPSGAVTAGILTGDFTATGIAGRLRSLSFTAGSGLSGSIRSLGALGIQSNGQDNTLELADPAALDAALAGNFASVQALFTDATNGIASQLNSYITAVTGPSGELTNHQADLTAQSNNLSTQIANLEKKIQNDSALWTQEFQAMEQAQARVNQELTYLSEQITNGTL